MTPADPSPPRIVLTVLGARSGTSAMAGVLGMLGCALPRRLMRANWANPKGYFEPQDLADLHDEILALADSCWSDWRAFPPAWFGSPAATSFQRRAEAVFRANYGDAALAVLKEPRMCRLLPLWEGVFAAMGTEPVFCFVDRAPLEVAASLRARDGSSIEQGLRYYIRNHLDAERDTRGRRRVFVSYAGLLADWRDTMMSVAAGLQIEFPTWAATEIDRFLDPGLRHQDRPTDDGAPTAIHAIASEVHAGFRRLAAAPFDPAAMCRLDALRAAFAAEAVALAGPLA